jgi:hypothetical protein
MKASAIFIMPLLLFPFLYCGKYIDSKKINGIIDKNDLSVHFKIMNDSEHLYKIRKIREGGDNVRSIEIDVHNYFAISTGEVPILPGKKYKISVTLKNLGANPILLYSFWKKPQNLTRHYAFVGEKGDPPFSRTQEYCTEWRTFEENFETLENEDYITMRLYANIGFFYLRNLYIEEINL